MISILNDAEIGRKFSFSADLSFFGMEPSQDEGIFARDITVISSLVDGSNKGKASELDLESRASNYPGKDFSGSMDSPSDRVRVSEVDTGREGSASASSLELAPTWMNGLKVGEMVWGKVKSHPWWPGHIFNEAFASSSVRKTKREGHVLVAFFGDSSYGWFDPAELIPFDPHFPEKSRQTSSRGFVKAVEEAVDEASRRGALALSCYCRNPKNFRPTSVPGYFAVDVAGFEPGGIYSSEQIENARDGLVPDKVISFVRQLGVSPQKDDSSRTVNWIKTMAALVAYRRAVFEEFDETYAQAFGVQPVRPSKKDLGMLDQPTRAPLSGPLVFAEALGDKKSSSLKTASRSGKNKYVLKRRDEAPKLSPPLPDLRLDSPVHAAGAITDFYVDLTPAQQQPQAAPTTTVPSSSSSSAKASSQIDNYVLQKRAPVEKPRTSPAIQEDDIKSPKPEITTSIAEKDETVAGLDGGTAPVTLDPTMGGTPDTNDEAAMYAPTTDINQTKIEVPSLVMDLAPEETRDVFDAVVVKKEKVRKRPPHDDTGDLKKKKKKKKKMKDETITELLPDRKLGAEIAQTDIQSKRTEARTPLDLYSSELELPQMLTDLSALAMDPFHGIERNAPDLVRHVFLRFRSKVYQKSLILPSEVEDDDVPVVVRVTKPDITKDVKERPKTSKTPIFKTDDPTKSGRKRRPSDRQEELSAKRIKKLNRVKALTTEKKTGIGPKGSEGPAKPITVTEPIKKKEPPLPPAPRIRTPTYLVMKFPPRASLPSVSSLKARFARFGTLDVSGTRVYWKTYTCKVLFIYKSDAEAALNYGKSNDLFGQVKVNYFLRDLEAPGTEAPSEPGIQFRPGNGNGGGGPLHPPPPPSHQQRQSMVQLKSILKKPPGDEAAPLATAANVKDIPRVKFMLGNDNDYGGGGGSVSVRPTSPVPSLEPVTRNPKSVNFGPPPPPPWNPRPSNPFPSQPSRFPPAPTGSPIPVLKPSLSPPVSLPPHSKPPPGFGDVFENRRPSTPFSEAPPPHPHLHSVEAEERDSGKADISYQMLDLLHRCNSIVTNVRSLTGYVPYRPL